MVGRTPWFAAGPLAALKARRSEVLQPVVSQHHGRIVKLMGDGVLVEFGSAVDAVECAVQLQKAMDAVNVDLPEDRRIVLRIGVSRPHSLVVCRRWAGTMMATLGGDATKSITRA